MLPMQTACNKNRRQLEAYHRTKKYVNNNSHPVTWTSLDRHKGRTTIWRARMNTLPFGDVLRGMKLDDDWNYKCICSINNSDNQQPDETIVHCVFECPIQEDLRDNRDPIWTEPNRDDALHHVLGRVKENGERRNTYSNTLLPIAIARAKKRMDTFIKIWHRRNATRGNQKSMDLTRAHHPTNSE